MDRYDTSRYLAPFYTVKLTYLYEPKSLADAWGDDEIIRLTESSIYLSESDSLVQISDDTVVKLGHTLSACSEALAADLVRIHTSTVVPGIRRVINHKEIVMDMIRGARQPAGLPIQFGRSLKLF
jgi:hypothetical protein